MQSTIEAAQTYHFRNDAFGIFALASPHNRDQAHLQREVGRLKIRELCSFNRSYPGCGLHTMYLPEILEKKVSRDLEVGDRMSWEVAE